jgi:hypothetical protein
LYLSVPTPEINSPTSGFAINGNDAAILELGEIMVFINHVSPGFGPFGKKIKISGTSMFPIIFFYFRFLIRTNDARKKREVN